ncbi:MAG: flavodoxin, partial [Candidatus Fermentibacteraceae bacterium]
FYSMDGNTRLVANTIARAAKADVLELVPEKEISARGFTRYLWGGKSVLMREKPALKPLTLDPAGYDMFFLGTPVWAWSMSPPLSTFLSRYSFSGKRVALFCCHGGGPGKVFRKMREAAPGGVFLGEIGLQEPRTNETETQLESARQWVGTILSKLG